MKRNLLLHLYPLRCHANWRRTVAHLVARWELFDGRRIVSVALDEFTDTPADVRAAFGGREIELRAVVNGPMQEVASFVPLLEAVAGDRESITLYAHGKGATHCDPASASHLWCDAMAEACLDYPRLVDCALADAATCGAFRSRLPIGWPGPSPDWHFAGTWYWFRNDLLFARPDWRAVDPVLWGVEAWPGWRFSRADSRCLFFDEAQTTHLYDRRFWASRIEPARRVWRRRLADCGLAPLAAAPAIPPPAAATRPAAHPLDA